MNVYFRKLKLIFGGRCGDNIMGTSCKLELYLHQYFGEQDQEVGSQKIFLHQYMDAHPSNLVPDLILLEREVTREKKEHIKSVKHMLSEWEISLRRRMDIYDLEIKLSEIGYLPHFEIYNNKTKLYEGCNFVSDFVYTLRIKERKDDYVEWTLKIQKFDSSVLSEINLDQIDIRKVKNGAYD